LVGLQGGKERKERDLEARVVKPGLKVNLGSFSEVSNMLKSTWPKFENFRARYARVLENSLISNKEAKIKEKEKGRGVIK
jgi:hypothetical protein